MLYRAVPDPSLVLYRDRPQVPLNGVGRLPAAMTINGVTEYPFLRYTPGGGLVTAAAWNPWGYGESIPVVAVATPPTLADGSPGLGKMDDGVEFNASDYFASSGNTFADVTTEDLVIEAVLRFSVTNGITFFGKTLAARGWVVYESSDNVRFFIGDATGNVSVFSGALVDKTWYHLICFLDRSGSGIVYVDGAAGTPVDISARSATLTTASPFGIGKAGALAAADNVHGYCAAWKGAGWLDTHLQATIAEQRASLFWGWRPQQARGTAVPTVRTRASAAYLDKADVGGRKLYLIGQNVPRAVSRLDANGALLKGLLSEVQITNLCLRSEEIDVDGAGSPWTHTRASVTDTSTTSLPNGLTSSNDVIHEDATAANTHSITQSISVTSGTKYVFSGWFKSINRSFVFLNVKNGGAAWSVVFNLSTGVASGLGASITEAGAIEYRNGWWRCWMSYTMDTTAAVTHYVLLYNGASISFNGLDQDSIYAWGLQLEAGVDYPTSYMPTAASAVIREEDVLRYKGDDGNITNNKRGKISCKILCPDCDLSVAASTIAALSDNASSADRIALYVSNSDVPVFISSATGGSAGSTTGTTDVFDNVIHDVEGDWKADDLRVAVDGAEEGSPDVDCGMPDDLDIVHVGASLSNVSQLNGVAGDITIDDYDNF